MKPCKRPVMIDALRVCYVINEQYHIEQLQSLKVGDRYDFLDFHLCRVDGKMFENVYAIRYHEPDKGEVIFGHLKFNMKKAELPNDETDSRVWIWVENWVFYDYMALYYLPYIASEIGLVFHNVTCIDLCIDLPFDLPRKLRRLLKSKDVTTILNGKRVHDRNINRPEISYIMSGSLNKTDKYLTVNIKQKNAVKDKSKGASLCCYDKLGEIENSSGKEYIRQAHRSPDKLYRIETHLNNAEIKDFLTKYNIPLSDAIIYDQKRLTAMFIETLDSLVRFEDGADKIGWEDLFGKYITTTPANKYLRGIESE